MENRLYTSQTSPKGVDCKTIFPDTPCFCTHRYKQHRPGFRVIPKERPIKLPCRAPNCKCESYHYVPLCCTSPIRCHCKHSADEHAEYGNLISGCTKCTGFKSSYTCGCGAPVSQHTMTVETAEERSARGHTVTEHSPYIVVGGKTG